MRTKYTYIFLLFAIFLAGLKVSAQNLTSSPYSRYGIGELNTVNFAAMSAMGGAFSAFQNDSTAPFFLNLGNPASLASVKLTTFELGGQGQFTDVRSATAEGMKRNANFSYGSLGFPIRRLGGGAFGIMPYTSMGYNISSYISDPSIGQVKYVYSGTGGFNKAFVATGLRPFHNSLANFYRSAYYDSLMGHKQHDRIRMHRFLHQLAAEFSVGASANYIFGNTQQTTDAVFPGSIYWYNTRRIRQAHVSDMSCNGGFQTAFSIYQVRKKEKKMVEDTLTHTMHEQTIVTRRDLKERIKITLGGYVDVPTLLHASQSALIYNYALDGLGNETPMDTALNIVNQWGSIKIPLEFGGGISIKKGERITVLLDGGVTKWSGFRYFNDVNSFSNSYRLSAGFCYIPKKRSYGSSNYLKRVQYRCGFTYSTGYLDLENSKINNYAVTLGLGLPVGIGRADDISMVNLSAQFGKSGTTNNSLLQENYVRLIVGFTFNKRWFVKSKYD